MKIVYDESGPFPVCEAQANFNVLSAYLPTEGKQLRKLVCNVEFGDGVYSRRKDARGELLVPAYWSVSPDRKAWERGTCRVDLFAHVVTASAEEIPGLITRMGLLHALVAASVKAQPGRLTIVAGAVLPGRSCVRLPLRRVVVDPRIWGKGLATLLDCKWGDLCFAPTSSREPAGAIGLAGVCR